VIVFRNPHHPRPEQVSGLYINTKSRHHVTPFTTSCYTLHDITQINYANTDTIGYISDLLKAISLTNNAQPLWITLLFIINNSSSAPKRQICTFLLSTISSCRSIAQIARTRICTFGRTHPSILSGWTILCLFHLFLTLFSSHFPFWFLSR
jgi:hypothetical protein